MWVGMVKEASCRALCLTFCPPPEPRLFAAAHQPALADLRAACFTPVQSAWSSAWSPDGSQTAGLDPGFKCAHGPWNRSTGPALGAM